jgi:23S rRNA pseudouridine1911/1915/1917 synthase
MYIPVIFEDSDIVVINKPSGIVVHPFDFSNEETILGFLQEKYPEMFSIENTITLQDNRIIALGGLVHKLDRETSGVLLIAKNQKIFDELQYQFHNQKVEKEYTALLEGALDLRPSHESADSRSFTIDAPLGRGKKEYKQSTNPVNPRGTLLEAVTDVRVIKRNDTTTLVKLIPHTGRTHQLRAHMSSIGHPIVGDIAYGSINKDSRIMLHAKSISLIVNGEKKMFTAELPEEFN